MTTQLTDPLTAETFLNRPQVAEAIETLVEQLRESQSSLAGARPASSELATTFEQTLERLASVRGKGAYYPYVGSGIGNGPLVELTDGSVKWDMINGIGVHMFGHSDPDLVATAIRAAMSDTVMQGNLQFNADSLAFAELLVEEATKDSGIRHCFLTNSGAMANENALKICMHAKDGKAPRIIGFRDCFMGRSTTMAQLGDSAGGRVGIPLNTHVDYVPFYDPHDPERSSAHALTRLREYVERYPGQHSCFVMELVQGEGGFNTAPKSFFEPLMKLCRKHEIAVWADEVQTFGRNQQMYYFQQLGVGDFVDVVTIGKMSQVCACLYTEALNPKPGLLSGTFIGSTMGLQVGRRILERLRDGGYYGESGRIAELQKAFRERAAALVERHPEWFPPVPSNSQIDGARRTNDDPFGGVGGMMRFTPFGGQKAKILQTLHTLFSDGVIAFYCGHGPFHIRFLPPVGVMEPSHFDDVFQIVEGALAKVASE